VRLWRPLVVPGVQGIAKRFGVNPGTMQRIRRLFAESVSAGV
jgi:hypothetical protein